AGADAEADGPRVQLQFAGVAAGHAQFRTGVHVARIGAGEPGRVDVHVHADGADRALGGLDTDMVAGVAEAIDLLVAKVRFVIAQAHKRTEHVVGSTEMVLRAQRHRLLFDGAGLGATGGAYAVVELVGGAPQLHSEIVVDVVAGAQGRGRAAIELVDALGRIALGL